MVRQELIDTNIKLITFDAPKGNLLSFEDIVFFSDMISKEEENTLVKGVIITGTNQSFCTGLKVDSALKEKDLLFKEFDILLYKLFSFSKPLIAAVNGHSIGGGLLFQLCADYVVMSQNRKIKIGLPELKLNTVLDDLMINVLEYSIGNFRLIQKLIYSGHYIQPEESLNYTLSDDIVAESDLMSISLDKMKKLISYNLNVFKTMKLNMRRNTTKKMSENLRCKCYEIF